MYLGILPAANQHLSMTEIEIDSQEDTKNPKKWSQVRRTLEFVTILDIAFSIFFN